MLSTFSSTTMTEAQNRIDLFEKYSNTFSDGCTTKRSTKIRDQSATIREIPKSSDPIEPGFKSFEEIKAECLASNTLWEDPDFPADDSSMFLHDITTAEDFPKDRPYIWKRPKVIFVSSLLLLFN